MPDMHTFVRIALRLAVIGASLLTLLGAWATASWLSSDEIAEAKVTRLDRVVEEKVSTEATRPNHYIDVAYVAWALHSDQAVRRSDNPADARGVLRWGDVDPGDPQALVGEKFLVNLSTGERADRSAVGLLFMSAVAALLLLVNACPLKVQGRSEPESASRRRGGRLDVILGGSCLVVAATLIVVLSTRAFGLSELMLAATAAAGMSFSLITVALLGFWSRTSR